MPTSTAISIGAGLVSSLLSAAAVIGSGVGLLLAYFSILPILLVGLSQGKKAANFATLSGIIGAALLSSTHQGIFYSISIAFPAWLIILTAFAPQREHTTPSKQIPIGEIISRLVILGGIILILSASILFDNLGDLAKDIESLLYKMIMSNSHSLTSTANHQLLVERMVPFFPAIIFLSWLLMIIINTVVSQAILVKAGINLKPAFQYSKIKAPEWIYWIFAASGLLILIGPNSLEYVSRNLTAIILIPFLFIGLSVVHTAARTFRSPSLILFPLYFFIIISSWPTFIAILVGFFEKWTKIRQKFKSDTP